MMQKAPNARSGLVARLAGLAVFGLGACIQLGACSDDRAGFTNPTQGFDDSTEMDAGECADTCSLDGRSVIRCTGEVVPCATELACGAGRCQAPCDAAAASASSNGCAFYLQPPLLISTKEFSQSCYATYVVNTSAIPVDLRLEYEGKELDLSKSIYTSSGPATLTPHKGPISPGDGVIVFVSDRVERSDRPEAEDRGYIGCPDGVTPALRYDYYPTGTQFGSSFHLSASAPVSAASIFPFGGAASFVPSGTLLLPVATWTKEAVLINAWSQGRTYPPGLQVVASEDDTEVTIVPRVAIQDGAGIVGTPAGVPAVYRLEKGQFLQLVQQQELTGSILTSTKPITTFGGHACSDIPSDVGTCDIIGTQIPAFEQWGSEYVGVGYRPRLGDEREPVPYRIVAARDGTRLSYDPAIPPGAPLELNAGELATFASGTGEAFVVRTQDAEHPIYVAAYMTGQGGDYWGSGRDFDTHGDPELVNVIPTGQYLNKASFYADPTYAETSLVVVRAKTDGEFKDVILDCLGGPVTGFAPVGNGGTYEFARVDISKGRQPGVTSGKNRCYYGAHSLHSEGAFTATLWGWDFCSSYAFPSGMATRKLVAAPLVTK